MIKRLLGIVFFGLSSVFNGYAQRSILYFEPDFNLPYATFSAMYRWSLHFGKDQLVHRNQFISATAARQQLKSLDVILRSGRNTSSSSHSFFDSQGRLIRLIESEHYKSLRRKKVKADCSYNYSHDSVITATWKVPVADTIVYTFSRGYQKILQVANGNERATFHYGGSDRLDSSVLQYKDSNGNIVKITDELRYAPLDELSQCPAAVCAVMHEYCPEAMFRSVPGESFTMHSTTLKTWQEVRCSATGVFVKRHQNAVGITAPNDQMDGYAAQFRDNVFVARSSYTYTQFSVPPVQQLSWDMCSWEKRINEGFSVYVSPDMGFVTKPWEVKYSNIVKRRRMTIRQL